MNRGTINRLRRARTMFCLLLIGCCSTLLSCTQEQLDGEMTEPVGGNVELRFKAFDTNATTDPEKAVNRVRVVVFGSYSSTDRGKLICNRYAIPDATGTISPILISAGMRDIYLVVNEPLGTDGTELASYKNIQSYDDLSNLQIPYKGGVGADVIARDGLPMLGCYINRMVRGESNVFGADVEYLMAKVSLTVKDVDGGPSENPTTGDVKVTSMKVCNIPYYSTLMASTYNSKEYYSQALPFTATTEGATVNNTTEFYLPEHIVKNADSKTYVEVKGENQKTNTISTWIVKLGDATVTTPTPVPAGTPYNITRNMHYTVVGTIKSYGEIEIVMDVQPWNVVNSNSVVGGYLTIDKTTINLEYGTQQSFVIKGSDVSKIQINNTNNAKNKIEITSSAENGTITVNLLANDATTTAITPDYDTFTITQGKITKSVTVNYRPHPLYLLAKGDLDAGGNDLGEQCLFINGGGGSGMMFRAASVIGIAVGMGGSPSFSQRIWFQPKTRNYTEIGDNIELVPPVVNTLAEYNLFIDPNTHPNPYYRQEFLHTPTAESVKAGIGDPCRLVGQTQEQIARGEFNTTWRLPKAGEIDYLWQKSNIVTSHADGGVYIGIKGVNERIAFFPFYSTTIYLLEKDKFKKGIPISATRYGYLTTGVFMPHIHAIEAVSTPEPNCGNSYLHQGGFGGEGLLAMLYHIRCIRQ